MKVIHGIVENDEPTPYAPIVLSAHVYFSDDPDSIDQCVRLALHEWQRYENLGSASWRPSTLTSIVMAAKQRSIGAVFTAGYVALALHILKIEGMNATFYAACKLVSNAYKKYKGEDPSPIGFMKYNDGTMVRKSIRVPTSREDVDKAFRKHSSVAHIVAAQIVASEYFNNDLIFEATKETSMCYLKTAAAIETYLVEMIPEQFNKQWSVLNSLSQSSRDWPILNIEEENLAFLKTGIL